MIGLDFVGVGTRHSKNFNVTLTLGQQEQADIGLVYYQY